jgi:hypothetical protein
MSYGWRGEGLTTAQLLWHFVELSAALWSLVGKLGSSSVLAKQSEDACALLHLDIRLSDIPSYNQHIYHVLKLRNFAL